MVLIKLNFCLFIVLFYIKPIWSISFNNNRMGCNENHASQQPLNRVDTFARLQELRKLLHTYSNKRLDPQAILITDGDEHQNEFVSDYNQRLRYISGFSGSNGNAIVTADKAVLWTDGRYHVQADEELDCNWILMKTGEEHVPSKEEWLISEFPQGAIIVADPKIISAQKWMTLESHLKDVNSNFSILKTHRNLIDMIWVNHTIPVNQNQSFLIDVKYTGKTWIEKLGMVRSVLNIFDADAMIVTALDEIAWLLNIRGYDVKFSNLLEAYVILSKNETIVYTNLSKIAAIRNLFENQQEEVIRFKDYSEVWNDLPKIIDQCDFVYVPSAVGYYSLGASKKIFDLVPDKKRLFIPSMIASLKQQKNNVEIKGMENSHIRDSVALCRFFQHLETYFPLKKHIWNEMTLVQLLYEFRSKENLFLGESFITIVGYGENGAIPHYMPSRSISSTISENSTIVIDSGGQYYDGTTDVTRTIHLGTPTEEQKQAYTRVLIGSIQMSNLIFPENLSPSGIDVMARASLWSIGYDYPHGTSHGVGYSLNVHEGNADVHYNNLKTPPLKPGVFLSNEPGYYMEGKFGVRLENVMEVVQKHNLQFQNKKFLGFKDITLVPYERKLIDVNLLDRSHIKWLNKYNTRIRNFIGPELLLRNDTASYLWMLKNTEYIEEK